MLFARASILHCPSCHRVVARESTTQLVDGLLDDHLGGRGTVVFPLPSDTPASLEGLRRKGFYRLTPDGREIHDLHDGDVVSDGRPLYAVTDRLKISKKDRPRLAEALDAGFHEGADHAGVFLEDVFVPLSRGLHCPHCDIRYEDPTPMTFSFNSPVGACAACRGFGDVIDLDPDRIVPDPSKTLAKGAIAPWQSGSKRSWQKRLEAFAKTARIPLDKPWHALTDKQRDAVFDGGKGFGGVRGFFAGLEEKIYKLHVRVMLSRYRRYVPCSACDGTRLAETARAFTIDERTVGDACRIDVASLKTWIDGLNLPGQRGEAAAPLLPEISRRLDVMIRAGLDYLSLERPSRTLSGGEYQRIRLAGALGSGLMGTLYVLDEPSVGLHARDGDRLLGILEELRDAGNTVVVVEHDRDLIAAADHVIDIGPGAGASGGEIVFEGPPKALTVTDAPGLTAAYISGRTTLPPAATRDLTGAPTVGVRGARAHNLQDLDIDIPLGGLVCVTGVSGSGKSTLIQETMYAGYRALVGDGGGRVGAHRSLSGIHHIQDMVLIDQSPIGRTPRSNPVTYMKAFDGIRKLFAETREANVQGLGPGDFSFNVPGGRCESCEGAGQNKIELQFLADIYVTCDACSGKRYRPAVLEVRYRGQNIHEVLGLTVTEAVDFFADTPSVSRPLWHLKEVGLGYLTLGQPATTLSGGEAQRLKIATHLAKRVKGTSVFILDEPTTGLHVDDISNLLDAFERLIQRGHTVLVVEHNLDIVARADWVIDLGPDGGAAGGRLVAEGTPTAVAKAKTWTGRYLAQYMKRWGVPAKRSGKTKAKATPAVKKRRTKKRATRS
jgi:excinuclease ABC subunit A